MKPGRDLDKLVAEKVMGWTEIETVPHFSTGTMLQGIKPDERASIYTGHRQKHYVPDYSTKIEAAWLVIDSFRETPFRFVIEDLSTKDEVSWRVTVVHNSHDATKYATADTPAHAICLAGLAAHGVDISIQTTSS